MSCRCGAAALSLTRARPGAGAGPRMLQTLGAGLSGAASAPAHDGRTWRARRAREPRRIHPRAADMPGGRQPQKGVGRAGGTRPGEAVEDAAGRRGVKEGHWRAHDLRAQPGAVSWAGAWRRCRPRRERSAADCADRQRAAGSAARLPGPVFRGGQPAWILPVCDAPPHVSLHGHIAAHLLG